MSTAVFPKLKGLTWNRVKTPQFSTLIQRGTDGSEVRASYYPFPIWKWALTYNYLDERNAETDLQQLMGFYLQRSGALDSFLFQDWNDNFVTAEQFAVGDGSTTTFALTRTFGGFQEPIGGVDGVTSTAIVYIDGVAATYGTDYTFTAGLVAFTTAPDEGALLTWTGNYYWATRFSEDSLDYNNFMYKLWELKTVELVSVR